MSWAKESAEVGLGGLTEWEAVRGVMGHKDFQLMPTPPVQHMKVVSASILYSIYIVDVHSTVYINLSCQRGRRFRIQSIYTSSY